MIDPMVSLTFAVHSRKGAYALLLGSGISKASGIPTGWDIVLDLIKKVAVLEGKDSEPDPAKWFHEEYGKDPDYSDLLEMIGKTQTERNQILKGYFEPTKEEREDGLKTPSEAHKAIAQLVASGFIKVIITTNFDRLLEGALEEVGISPAVISTPDAAEGALPIAHSNCTVIKVHGDYLDSRIKNTKSEVSAFDDRINDLLDRVFDDYGLIVCGWSADWDVALRQAIERCSNRRFSTYWCYRSNLSDQANKIIKHLSADAIQASGADQFFNKILENVSALDEMSRPHPLSAQLAVATLKKYLSEDRYSIKLNDLILDETKRVYDQLTEKNFPAHHPTTKESLWEWMKKLEIISDTLAKLVSTGCLWSNEKNGDLWSRCLEKLGNPPDISSGKSVNIALMKYPALLILYAGGVSSLIQKDYRLFASLLTIPKSFKHGRVEPLIFSLSTFDILHPDNQKLLPNREREYTPLSNHLMQKLKEFLSGYINHEKGLEEVFDRFEYVYSLVRWEMDGRLNGHGWAPFGCFGWRNARYDQQNSIMKVLQSEIEAMGEKHPLLKVGLFQDSLDRFIEVKSKYDAIIPELHWH